MGYIYSILKKLNEGAKWIGDSETVSILNGGFPNPFDEGILITIVSSYGKLVGILLVMIIAYIILKMFSAASKIKDLYGKMLSFAIATLFAVQFTSNILMNLGYLPFINMNLPFVSYGGVSMIFDMAFMGLLLGIYRRKDIILPQIDKGYSL
jgi:cell division protein FtsW (lipid II flippase)